VKNQARDGAHAVVSAEFPRARRADEPLDLATKEMLLEALADFDGTMLFVSHDREFLRGLSNRVLELGGDSGTDAAHAIPDRT